MRLRQRSCCVLLCLAAASSVWGADAALPGYLPPGARTVIGIRVRSLMDGLKAQGFGKEIQEALTRAASQSPLPGMDAFRDLDEIWVAYTGAGPNPPFLAVITGRFSEAGFPGGSRYGKTWIVKNNRIPGQVAALVDARTALAGDPALVKAALDRGGAASQIDPSLAARLAPLRGKYDIWGAGNPVLGAKPAAGDPLGSMDRFDFGVTFTRGMECVADLHVRSPQDLEKLNSLVKVFELALKARPNGSDNGQFDLRTENGGIHLAISIPEEELQKAVAMRRAAITSALASRFGNLQTTALDTSGAATRVVAAPSYARPNPTAETQIIKDARGDTRIVTLPGKQ